MLEIENKEGKISTPRYLKLPTTGMYVGNVKVTKDELRGIREDLVQLIIS